MRKFLLSSALLVCAAAATPAAASTTLTFAPTAADGSTSGMFGDTGIAGGTFNDTFTFTLPVGTVSSTISSIFSVSTLNNLNFTSVTLNGVPFNIVSQGAVEFRTLLGSPVAAGTQTLAVSGTSGGNGSYSGTIAFSPVAAAVPEPAAWGMMILGLGMMGTVVRRQRKQSTRVTFA